MTEYSLVILFIISSSMLGYKLVNILPLQFSKLEFFAVGAPLGLIVATEINFILALLFRRVEILPISISIAIIIISVLIMHIFFKKNTYDKNQLKTWPFFAIFFSIGIYIIIVLSTKILTPGGNGNLLVGPPALYGDTALHASYISKLANGRFPVENPLFAGMTLTYPYMNNFLSAILINLGANLRTSFVIPQILFLIGFLALYFKLARKFVDNFGATLAISSWFLGWGVGFYFFLNELANGTSFIEFVQSIGDFTHNDKYHLNLHNFITGMILPERTFLPGLFLGMILANIFVSKKLGKLKDVILSGVILGILPLWHTHSFIFFSFATFIWFQFWISQNLKEKLKKVIVFFSVAAIFSLPFYLPLLTQVRVQHFITFIPGWMTQEENVIAYWFKNSFLIIPAAILGFFLLSKGKRLFFVPALAIFVIANLVSFQPWEWDNIKLFAWSLLFLSILAGNFYIFLIKKNIFFKTTAILIFITSIFSGLLAIGIPISGSNIIYDAADIELATWVENNTNKDDVFLTETFHNHPIPGLAGRSIYIGYPGFLWVHGIQYTKRESETRTIMSGNLSQLNNLEVPISYVVVSSYSPGYSLLDNNFNQTSVEKVYKNNKYLVLKVI